MVYTSFVVLLLRSVAEEAEEEDELDDDVEAGTPTTVFSVCCAELLSSQFGILEVIFCEEALFPDFTLSRTPIELLTAI